MIYTICYDTVHYMQYTGIFNHPGTMHKKICIVLFYGIQNQHLSLGNGFYVLCILYFFVFRVNKNMADSLMGTCHKKNPYESCALISSK